VNRALALTNAILTTVALVCMLAGWRTIKRKDVQRHKRLMLAATAASAAFVVVFVIRFVGHGFTPFHGTGVMRCIYYAVFFSHEPLAVVNVPLVIVTAILGLTGSYAAHKEVAQYALPIWIYVAVTGSSSSCSCTHDRRPSGRAREKHLMRILVVDDSELVRVTLVAILEDAGHVVAEADSLAAARRGLTDATLDLVVLDVHLPDGLGPSLIPDLRAALPGVTIVVLTGEPTPVVGADLVLSKVDDPLRLLEYVRQVVAQR
jgi:uncharacterized membrane protein YozB (DUF420 family)/CheY-like chemotaxis protein